MKKTTLIASILIILLIILAPLIGNTFMQKLIDENVEALKVNGLVLKRVTGDSGYLNTKKHFEFVLQNADAFTNYVSAYTKTKMPSYVKKILSGVTLAVDAQYSNIPFSKAITLQIYMLRLSSTLMQEMQMNDPDAYKHFVHFLASKGILYHIEYNLVSKDFNGFIKDIDDAYTFKDGAKLLMQLQGARFRGHGDILAPKRLSFTLNKMKFDVNDGINIFSADINTLRSSSDFESFSKYTSSTKVFFINLLFKSPQDDINISLDKLDVSSTSTVKNEKVALRSKSFIESLVFHSKKIDFSLQTFNSDISVNALDKQSYENFSLLLAQSKTMNKALLQQKMQKSLLTLLSHGLHVKVSDISLQNITINKVEELGSMKIQSDLKVKADKDLAAKSKITPMLLLSNIEMDMNIKLANALYLKLIEDSPMAPTIASYVKKDADSVYFDIHFQDAKLMINDKTVQ
ncbi:hypothetical protein [Sulfurimonas autotrophica]|uniref:DUF945 domain-containing protein n=1 Tax=Sulfurimonas autotrophica (strain ATCC BAA-671 / DSM 16294 / JCM 11897 / OK10) TaxID=563040 RepID=E0UR32_SULAO|nr:hypothetical protein [Sulfurimonas autotrophica]ADN09988.1 hypothetical protein Saut_1945 [Sulfurimonas autotrophica DSM 16294]